MITVHGRKNSSNVQKVRWALTELDLDYRIEEAGRGHAPLDTDEFLTLNPFGLIPAIEIDGVVGYESNAILRHLAASHPDAGFWPSDPQDRLTADAAMDWAASTLWPALRPPFVAVAREGVERSDPALAKQIQSLVPPLMALERRLGITSWLSGDEFGFADIPAAVYLSRLVWLVGRGALPPEIAAWYDACAEREAWDGIVYVAE